MTTEQAAAPAADEEVTIPEVEITFQGRSIWTRMPTPEQLLVWDRTVRSLTEAPPDASWTGSQVMKSLDRLRRIVDTILVNRADVEWLDDEFLDGKLTFKDLAPMIALVVDGFADAAEQANATSNRAAKRAAAKPKKAARKKATS
jgi:hypothetical protein